ncbi:MAG TPA: hypothetical protein VIK72_11820 [Clostridiaceae bacterium]
METYRNFKALKPRLLLIQISLGLFGIFIGYYCKIYTENKKWNNYFYPRVSINNIVVGEELLTNKYNDKFNDKSLIISANNKIYSIPYSKLIIDSNLDYVLSKAFDYGKNQSFFIKNNLIKSGTSKNFAIKYKIDRLT